MKWLHLVAAVLLASLLSLPGTGSPALAARAGESWEAPAVSVSGPALKEGVGKTPRPDPHHDPRFMPRTQLERGMRGVLISRVEPLSPGFDAELERGQVILEVNRTPVTSARDFERLVAAARPGDVLAIYVYLPDREQRALRTVRVEQP